MLRGTIKGLYSDSPLSLSPLPQLSGAYKNRRRRGKQKLSDKSILSQPLKLPKEIMFERVHGKKHQINNNYI